MRRSLLVFVFITACTPPPQPEPADAHADVATDIGPCAEGAALFSVDDQEKAAPLQGGSTLAITRGFQGLFFVRLGLRTPAPLPPQVRIAVHVAIAGRLDQTSKFQVVPAAPMPEGGFQTADVPFFFNDTPFAELIGQQAHVEVWSTTTGCRLVGQADVQLISGSFMGADAAFWQDAGTDL